MVTNELRGEKVDIVPFSDDPREFVMRALQPAKVKEVHLDEGTGTATVIVHDFQLSLAIGKEGQNARLAARLTGWRIDIKSEAQVAEEQAYADQEWAEGEWVETESGEMVWQPAEGGEAVSAAEWSHTVDESPEEVAAEPAPAESVVEEVDAARPSEAASDAPEQTGEAQSDDDSEGSEPDLSDREIAEAAATSTGDGSGGGQP
jgi:N utilization substance protein A